MATGSPTRSPSSNARIHGVKRAWPSIFFRNGYSPDARSDAPSSQGPRTRRPAASRIPTPRGKTLCVPFYTDPAGKLRGPSSPAASAAGGHRTRIPTLWGKNTDPSGRRCDRGAGLLAPRSPLQAVELPSYAAFWRYAAPGWPFRPLTDLRGNEYRPHRETIPTLWGESYRPRRENLPTPVGYFTEPDGVDYRPCREICRTKYLQRRGFCYRRIVYMMFCLCLVLCPVNREELGG